MPSAEIATDDPIAPPAILSPSWLHVELERRKTHTAPGKLLSNGPPTIAVLPSAEIATAWPCWDWPMDPLPTSLGPCWVQAPFVFTNTQAAPVFWLSPAPPTMAVFPSFESAMEVPTAEVPEGSVGLRFPCRVQTPLERVNTQTWPIWLFALGSEISRVFPSPDNPTAFPW